MPCEATDWITAFGTIASLAIATTAIVVTRSVAKEQKSLQERQLKKDLFEKRLAVYRDTAELLRSTRNENEIFDILDKRYPEMLDLTERADFLFGPEVANYVETLLQALTTDLHVKIDEMRHKKKTGEPTGEISREILERTMQIRQEFRPRLKPLFQPYLSLISVETK